MSLWDWVMVGVTIGFSSLCSEYAKDFKRLLDEKFKVLRSKVKK